MYVTCSVFHSKKEKKKKTQLKKKKKKSSPKGTFFLLIKFVLKGFLLSFATKKGSWSLNEEWSLPPHKVFKVKFAYPEKPTFKDS